MLWLDGAVEQPWWQSIRQRDVQVHFLQCLIPLVDCFSCTTMDFQPPKHPWIIHSFRSLLIASLAELTYHRPACTKPRWSSSSSSSSSILSASQHESQASWMMGFCEEDTKHTYIHTFMHEAVTLYRSYSFCHPGWLRGVRRRRSTTPEGETHHPTPAY